MATNDNEVQGEHFQHNIENGDMPIHVLSEDLLSDEPYTIYGTKFVSKNVYSLLILEAQDFYTYYGESFDCYEDMVAGFKGEILSTYFEYKGERYEPTDKEAETAFDIAVKIKYLRKKSGLSQEEMSNKFDIPKRTIQNWESCTNICPHYVFVSIVSLLSSPKAEIAAIQTLYEDYGMDESFIFNDIKHDFLAKCIGKSGRNIIWYLDEGRNIAIYVDTQEYLTKEEIKDELC